MKWRNFEEAIDFVRLLKLESRKQWQQYCKSGDKPGDIPALPSRSYKDQWKGWGDWLGTRNVANFERKFRSYSDAREFVHGLRLRSKEEWRQYCKLGKPSDVPSSPDNAFRKEWKGWGDWLGTGKISPKHNIKITFEEAREYARSLGLKSKEEWEKYRRSKLQIGIPTHPDRFYINSGWKGWRDWLGLGKKIRPFLEARDYVRSLGFKSTREWEDFAFSSKRPKDVPTRPDKTYKEEWVSVADWCGYEESTWTIRRVKELLKAIIDSGIIYSFTDVRLYDLLNSKGLLSLGHRNRHDQFFRNLIEARNTDEGRKAIEEYAKSEAESPPDLVNGSGDEIEEATPEELSSLVDNSDPLESYDKIRTPEQIMKETEVMDSICVDQEMMQFQVNCSVQDLWKSAFKNELNTVSVVKSKGFIGNKFHDMVNETFLLEYKAVQKIREKLPKGYDFPSEPRLMQLFLAHKVNTRPYFGNFSRTGSGKTLSAILASRIINSKMTVIVCPNDVVEQWKDRIVESFPDSDVITGKEAFNVIREESKHKYVVLNYDKFSQDYSDHAISILVQQKIDFLVLDEIHFVKRRDETNESQRHRRVVSLRISIRDRNRDAKVLAMSATPVINELTEGKSQLEILTGKVYHDVKTRPTISNAVNLHQKLSLLSVREKREYANVCIHFSEVNALKPSTTTIKELKKSPLLIEKVLTEVRIPDIVEHISGQTIIYTEYVTEIIEKLIEAIKNAGYSYALFTGEMKDLQRFKNGKAQVLIASRPISVGVDELQYECNRLIFNTLPYTHAQYEQLIGRLDRIGQDKDVDVFVIKASIGGFPYDEEIKWKRIQFKRSLADCAIDGTLPRKKLVTPEKAAMAAVEWLERLEHGLISNVSRRDLVVKLPPTTIKQRQIILSNFSKLNNEFNKQRSESAFQNIRENPQKWIEYHRDFRESRKDWPLIPVEALIERIGELSPRLKIGDFGCGEAQIAQTFGKDRVNSFDFVAIDDSVKACDMKSTGIPDGALDIAIFSLSLMETNWVDFIIEANRCLAKNGYIFIAETSKSLNGRLLKLKDVLKMQGFDIYSVEERGDFTFIEARKL